jgi:Skp family chaperone for outer membrane proteins
MDFTTLRADLLSARTLLSNQADQIAAHSIALANQLATLKEKAHRKLESQKQKYDAEAEKKEKARRAEEDRLKLERKMMEEKAKTAAEEKRQAINRAEEFRAKERERLETCDRQLGQVRIFSALSTLPTFSLADHSSDMLLPPSSLPSLPSH